MRNARKKAVKRLVITAIIMLLGTAFLWSLRDYAIERDNMRLAKETAFKIGKNEQSDHDYEEARGNIISSTNFLVRMYYQHETAMSYITLAIAVITFASVMYMGYIVIFIKRDIARTQKRGRRA